MTPPEHIRRLFEHMWWADARVGASLAGAQAPPDRAVALYGHLIGAELVWLDRVARRPPSSPVWPDVSLAECRRLAQQSRARYAELLDRLTPSRLAEVVPYTNSAGAAFESRLEDILLHVALHGAYHRGQVALLLRDGGIAPAPTDYIAHVRGAAAATRSSG